ncbi:hypothetical protein GYM62_11945 [Algoriphagus sp. NBT04N3]|uniref:hypothetical protein n=1 Tax=Algoriphagus sp. NBT04N3 TaxID=2705473 RepID=UPI001C63A3FF|nr:hypothetical protein [Algoriphagus sp. NBT04N3]QYH39460.1 hypothetical protein GYM62_11945 [Algoriphagus sp. NBT04N3]
MNKLNAKENFIQKPSSISWSVGFLVCFLLFQCTTQKVSRELVAVEEAKNISPKKEYLKIHMKNGDLYVLNKWDVNESIRFIEGMGTRLDPNRKPILRNLSETDSAYPKSNSGSQKFRVPFDDIVIVETNNKSNNPGVAAMVVTSVVTVPLAISCIINPKSCFGSCPTFYVQENGEEKLVAEGFSSSISRSLEETDIDRFHFTFPPGQVSIQMKNEALETHMVKSIQLIVCEKSPENQVFESKNSRFFEVDRLALPQKAMHHATSIKEELSDVDDLEWYSLADSLDLSSQEEIFLEFENLQQAKGLVIDKRQSLMTTFLFYQMLAYSGNATGYLLHAMETRKPGFQNRIKKMYERLGGIEIAMLDKKGNWKIIEEVTESGPIASDTHLVLLPELDTDKISIRLRFTQGLWRINQVNLASIVKEVLPKRILPDQLISAGSQDSLALEKLRNPSAYLVTYPGDEYRIHFPIESSVKHQYFLESQGYYIEWMREEWLKEENFSKVKWAMIFPRKYLKKAAPLYKENETEMEAIFWNSKYATSDR